VEPGREALCRVRFRAVASVADLTPKELYYQRKKEWKRLHRTWRLEKQAREQERLAPALGVVQLREVQARRARCRLRNGRRVSKEKPRS
jgi:hypothetical protein